MTQELPNQSRDWDILFPANQSFLFGDKTFTIKPLSVKNYAKLIRVFQKTFKEIEDSKDTATSHDAPQDILDLIPLVLEKTSEINDLIVDATGESLEKITALPDSVRAGLFGIVLENNETLLGNVLRLVSGMSKIIK